MSIIRITEGDNKTTIENGWTVFTDYFDSYAGQRSHFTATEGTFFGTPAKDKVEETKYFMDGWWSDNSSGDNKITKSAIGKTVYFHIRTKGIPNTDPITQQSSKIGLQLYDDDGGLAGEPDPINVVEVVGKDPTTGEDLLGGLVTEKEVIDNKILYNLTLSDGLVTFIEQDYGDDIELYFACSYKEDQDIKLPLSEDLYLKVELCDKEVIQSFNNKQYGSCDFYRFRYDDFMRRHKHCKHQPPVYYFGEMRELNEWSIVDNIEEWWTPSLTEEMRQVSVAVQEVEKQGVTFKPVPSTSYGFKYCIRFSRILMPKLTIRGKSWLSEARYKLQVFMELGVINKTYTATYDTVLIDLLEDNFNDNFEKYNWDTWSYEFDQETQIKYYTDIEIDNDRFQEFAFASHPDAYSPLEMQKLPLEDLIRVALTPDLKEWFGEGWWMTLKQAILIASNYNIQEIKRLINEFDSEEIKIFLDEIWENIFN